jgi:hypothetical protein
MASVVLAGVAAVFALIALYCSVRCERASERASVIASALHSARSKIDQTAADLDAVADQLATLRGKFYATRNKSGQSTQNSDSQPEAIAGVGAPPGDSRLAWKAQMRDKYGIGHTPRK